MGAVFVSYRREVSEGQARALSLELVRLLGKDSVFMDVDGIALGRDFRQVLQERLNSCDMMLTLIKDGSLTRMAIGGVFEFAWPGKDCWAIFRGGEEVTHHCGTSKQALGAGRYTIKGKYAPVFAPFDITVSDAAVVKKP